MRAAPQVDIEVVRFGVWRAATLALTAVVWAVMLAWWWAHPAPAPAWVIAVALLAMLGAAAAALPSFLVRRVALRGSAGRWQLAVDRGASRPAVSGDLLVALDLGAWLLLRFIPDAAGERAAWVAVQRAGLEAHWHALRCAVYAPRPAPRAGTPVDA